MVFAFLGLGTQELLMILVLGVLLFGRRLPEVGRAVGKTVVEFKKGMAGMEDQITAVVQEPRTPEPEALRPPQKIPTTNAPRFDDAHSNLPPQV